MLRTMNRLARGSPDARASLGLCLLSCLCRIGLELDLQGVRSEISEQRAEALTSLLLDWRSFRGSDGGTQSIQLALCLYWPLTSQ